MTDLLLLFKNSSALLITSVTILGLLIGSFLNVVIYRLPIMMKREWRCDCLDFLEMKPDPQLEADFNLLLPGSACPHCQAPIKAWQNIPVISYLLLKGRCSNCNASISIRYPCVEALTGLTSGIVAWHFGYGAPMLFALIMTWSLIALSFIDIDHQLLPDSINLPILWLGLLLSLFHIYSNPVDSLIGAMAGYLSLWSVYHVFKLVTGKEGMGYGDFKLLALFGAWFGWPYLPQIILMSSLVGAVIGISMVIFVKKDHNIPIPFGPYLAIAGWLAMLWGKDINQIYLNSVGL
jgi:leader peptidase (prepilin peptidase)/N-methyltransferase